MSVQRALEVLGLSGSPSTEEVRRAYLRSVKQHPPERDRDGFQRVREAYDFLKSNPWLLLPEDDEEDKGEELPFVAAAPIGVATAVPTAAEPDSVPAEQASEESFPGDDDDMALLHQALDDENPAAAAKAMIALYERPILQGGPVPPALFCLQTFMVLIERHRFKRAHALLRAFEKYAETHQLDASLGNEIGARWVLAREVAALTELDERLARAMARSLRHDELQQAADAAERAISSGVPLERFMKARTPTLWASLAPLLRPREVARSRSTGFPQWPIVAVVVMLFHVARVCTPSASAPPAVSVPTRPDVVVAQARDVKEHEQEPPTFSPQVSFRERAQRQVDASWSALRASLERGDCQGVADQWPLYRVAASDELIDANTAAARKKEILTMCAELDAMLEEKP